MRRPRVKVVLPRRLAEGFKRRAKASKVEVMAVLVGHQRGDTLYEITDVIYPAPDEVTASKAHVNLAASVYCRAEAYGKVLGDIHSHPPGYEPVPSEHDWAEHWEFPLMAICHQDKNRAGIMCARIKFYPRLPIVDLRVA